MYGESIGDMFYNVSADFTKAEQDLKAYEQKQSNRMLLLKIGIDLSSIDADLRKLDEKIGQSRTIKIKLDTAEAEAQMDTLGGRFGSRVSGGTMGRQTSVLAAAAPNIMGTSNGDVSMGPGQFLTNPVSTGAVMANAMYRATPVSPGPSAPAATVNPDLMAWSQNPVMKAAYRGNPDVVGRQLADRLGVSPDDVQAAMAGQFGGQKSITTASPLMASKSTEFYSGDRFGGAADDADMQRHHRGTVDAFMPMSPRAGRESLWSHNDSLARSLDLDSLDDAIPSQMKGTQQALRRDSQAAELRARRVARRDDLQMQKDMRRSPLTDRELIDEQVARMPSFAAVGSSAGDAGVGMRMGGRAGSLGIVGGLRGFMSGQYGAAAGILGLETLSAGASMINAGLNRDVAMHLAGNDQSAQARAELAYQKERNDALPLGMGGIGFGIRNAINSKLGGPTEQDVATNLGDADRADRITQIQHQSFVARRTANFQIKGLQAHQDAFTQQRITIASQVDQATIEANAAGVEMRNNGTSAEVANAEVKRRANTAGMVAAAQTSLNNREESLSIGQIRSQTRAAQLAYGGDSMGAAMEQYSAENLHAELDRSPPGARDSIVQRYNTGAASVRRDFARETGDINASNRSGQLRLRGYAFEGAVNDFYADRDRALRDISPSAEPERFAAVSGAFQVHGQEMLQSENSRRAMVGVQVGRVDSNTKELDFKRQHKYSSAAVESIMGDAGADIATLNAQNMRPEERVEQIRAIKGNTRARLGLVSQDIRDRFEQGSAQETGLGITHGDIRSRKEVESFVDDTATLEKLKGGEAMVKGLDKGAKNLNVPIKLSGGGHDGLSGSGGGGAVDPQVVTLLQEISKNTEGGAKAG